MAMVKATQHTKVMQRVKVINENQPVNRYKPIKRFNKYQLNNSFSHTPVHNPYVNTWHIFRNTVDIVWYAVCRCNYSYRCTKTVSNDNKPFRQELSCIHHYCPICGRKYNLSSVYDFTDVRIPEEIWYGDNTGFKDLLNYYYQHENKGG